MKLLLDQNLSFKLCQRLADVFPGSTHARLTRLDRADDRMLWKFAGTNEYTLVSLDSDFAEMATVLGPPPKVIWLRCGNQPTEIIEMLLRERVEAIVEFEASPAACFEIY